MLTRAVGIFALSVFALAALLIIADALTKKDHKRKSPPGVKVLFPMPALVLEFAKPGSDLKDSVEEIDEDGVREKLQKALCFDSFFITLYLLLFVGIALVLGQRGGAAWIAVAVVVVGCAIGAAGFDGMENLAMARAIELRSAEAVAGTHSAEAADAIGRSATTVDIATPGLLKWVMSFVCLTLLAFTFWGRGWTLAWVVFGLCMSIAVLGLAGLAVLRNSPGEFRPVQLAFMAMLVLTLLVGIVFTCRPEKFERAVAVENPTPVARQGG